MIFIKKEFEISIIGVRRRISYGIDNPEGYRAMVNAVAECQRLRRPEEMKTEDNTGEEGKQEEEKATSLRAIAKKHGVSRSALSRRILGQVNMESGLGRHPEFSPFEEDLIYHHLLRMAEIGYGYEQLQILNLMKIVSKIRNTNYSNLKLSYRWLQGFLRRHPTLTIRKAQGLEKCRAKSLDEEGVAHYFDILEKGMKLVEEMTNTIQISPFQVFNLDEIGFDLRTRSGFAIAKKGVRSVYRIEDGNRNHISVIACVSAGGFTLDPYFLLKGVRLRKKFDDNIKTAGFLDSKAFMTKKAYIDDDAFLNWCQYFISQLKRLNIIGALLVLDGHNSHRLNLPALKYLNEHNVIVITLPSHSTHILQPLDVGLFKPLRQFMKSTQTEYQIGKKVVGYDDFPYLLRDPWNKAFTQANIKASMFYFSSLKFKVFHTYTTDIPSSHKSMSNGICIRSFKKFEEKVFRFKIELLKFI
jgi:hypothetical protein